MQYKVKNVRTLNEMANSLLGQGGDGAGVPAVPHRAAHHAALAAGRVREERPVAADAEHRVARAAAVAGQVRRPAAPLPRDHAERVQPAPDLARLGAHQLRPTPTPIRRSSSTTCPPPEDRKVAVDGMRFTRRIMAAKALAKYEPEEFRPGSAVTQTKSWSRPRASSAPPSSIRSAPARWAATPWRWWTTACACRASTGCA